MPQEDSFPAAIVSKEPAEIDQRASLFLILYNANASGALFAALFILKGRGLLCRPDACAQRAA